MGQDTETYELSKRNRGRNCEPLGLLTSVPTPETRFSCLGLNWFALPRGSTDLDMVMIVVDYFKEMTVVIPCKM